MYIRIQIDAPHEFLSILKILKNSARLSRLPSTSEIRLRRNVLHQDISTLVPHGEEQVASRLLKATRLLLKLLNR